jgi:hypothetical protein
MIGLSVVIYLEKHRTRRALVGGSQG